MFTTPERNHPFFIAERTYSYILLLSVILLNGMIVAGNEASIYSLSFWIKLFESLREGDITVLFSGAGAVLLLAFIIIISGIRWSRTFFSINDDVLTVERKTLFKKTSRLPVVNITTVNIERNVFERAIGVSKVKIDVNSSATADKTDFTFLLKADKAAAFKDELMKRRSEATSAGAAETASNEPARIVEAFSSEQAVRHKLLSIPLAQVIVTVSVLASFFSQAEENINFLQLIGVSDSGRVSNAADVIGIITALLAIYFIPTALSVLNNCRYTLSCDSKKIYISRGLLKTFNYSFERSRINAVTVRQPLLARIFGLYSIEVAVVGLGNEKNETSQLCLLSDKNVAHRILAECAPDYALSAEKINSSRVALIPSLFATLIFTVFAALISLYKPLFGIIGICASASLGIICSILGYKTKKLAYNSETFSYTSGILSKKTIYVKYSDIQTVSYRTNIFFKRFGAGRICYTILSGQQTKVQITGWFPEKHYEQAALLTSQATDALI